MIHSENLSFIYDVSEVNSIIWTKNFVEKCLWKWMRAKNDDDMQKWRSSIEWWVNS